jgi:hypothetical protein
MPVTLDSAGLITSDGSTIYSKNINAIGSYIATYSVLPGFPYNNDGSAFMTPGSSTVSGSFLIFLESAIVNAIPPVINAYENDQGNPITSNTNFASLGSQINGLPGTWLYVGTGFYGNSCLFRRIA